MSDFTKLEQRAMDALNYPAFPLNLREIRDNVKSLLGEVQRYGFFNEYTTHSFEHVIGMLETAEWLIPDRTKELLSSGDWLLLTLSIYFHDIGLLVSNDEFSKRSSNPEYSRFITDLPSGDDGVEYVAKLNELDSDERERILYQEFVRSTHGARVKAWIEGVPLDDNEASRSIRDAIQGLLGKLDSVARRDLALLCESHTIDDISDINKYKVSMPYGQSPHETVNLQYTAIVLRVVDLLQITRLRAPAVLYQVINPKDPISQVEWQKQGAVRSIRPAPGRDREGRASDAVLPDTIEVHARFEKSDGFFGLTSYLAYAKSQLDACQEALKKSEHLLVHSWQFPWKYIDDRGVEAEGFLTEAFGFELDQQKILDLLTGHTLYNDTDVVVRELTQNALDAIRLQAEISGRPTEEFGEIKINWDSQSRVLEVVDNGTGMSQSVIEGHLLKVGSSRYQDPKFKESYPGFSSISRFGIGVLSAFMVADNVEITTCSPDDDKARNISLRSVHGKYLIKLLDKVSERGDIGVHPNGTKVRMTLRATAAIGDVLEVAKKWLLFPRCSVVVRIDNAEPVSIGFSSPKEALENYLTQSSYSAVPRDMDYAVREVSEDGVTLAYVVLRDELFKDWSFVQLDERRRYNLGEDGEEPLVATCIEGVGVEFVTPGFNSRTILAVANVVGKGAPKTNVARSALEDTSEYRDMLKKLYKLYTRHVTGEIKRLSNSPEYSLSRAVQQAPYIAAPFLGPRGGAARPALLEDELSNIPLILLEGDGERSNVSLQTLRGRDSFWTVDSPLTSSVEFFVREAPKDICASMILEKLQDASAGLPLGETICNLGATNYYEGAIRGVFEPVEVRADENARRVSLKWEKIGTSPRWVSSRDVYRSLSIADKRLSAALMERNEYRRHGRTNYSICFAIGDINVSGLDSVADFLATRQVYLNPIDPIAVLLRNVWLSNEAMRERTIAAYLVAIELIRGYPFARDGFSIDALDRIMRANGSEVFRPYMDDSAFVESVRASKGRTFNPFAWKRRSSEDDGEMSGDFYE